LTLTLSSKTTHSDLSFEQMDGLRTRVGIEGFFCIVRNTPDFHMKPQWYFTTEALADYMKIAARKWDTHNVGMKVEAFAIAGCDPVSKCCFALTDFISFTLDLFPNAKKKADYLKTLIRDKINTMLGKFPKVCTINLH
jgi:hypothetical protein